MCSGHVVALLALALVSCGAERAQDPFRSRTTTPPGSPADTRRPVSYPASYQPLLDILGALRRPQAKPDLDPAALARARTWSRSPTIRMLMGVPVIALIRFGSVAPWRRKVFLIPTKPLTRTEISKLPAQDRARARAQNRAFPGLRLGAPAVGGASVAQIKAGLDFGTERSDQLVLVVPDGADKVKIWVGLDRGPTHTRTVSITARVHNNIAAFLLGRGVQGQPLREVWYGGSGRVIKRIDTSRCRSALQSCA